LSVDNADCTSVRPAPATDVRGRTVLDRDDSVVGTVDDLLIETRQNGVCLVRIDHGVRLGILATPVYLPVELVVRLTEGMVSIDRSWFQVAAAPPFDPGAAADLYEYYGCTPFWVADCDASGPGSPDDVPC
jgi:hypothetical protein